MNRRMIPDLDICIKNCPLKITHTRDACWRITPGINNGHSRVLHVRRSPDKPACMTCTLSRRQKSIQPPGFPSSKEVRRFFAKLKPPQVNIDQEVCPYYVEHFLKDTNRQED